MSTVSNLKPEDTKLGDTTVDYIDLAKKLLTELRQEHSDQDIDVEITQGYDKQPRVAIRTDASFKDRSPSSKIANIFMVASALSAVTIAAGYVYSVVKKTDKTTK